MPMNRRIAVLASALIALAGVSLAGVGAWQWFVPGAAPEDEAALPVPPFPPRIAQGQDYENCLAALADDPANAISLADSLAADGSNEAAAHCRGLALIALGKPDTGAALLEKLAVGSAAPPLGRASVLGQAAQ